jgi:tRNA/tmRNA/rRNA uracil-C5-methylase (TrmA/RlmC/RlmD family)
MTDPAIGDLVEVALDRVAHGGHVVGRVDGRVLFVRHGLPGETVTARITEIGPRGRYLRADAIEISVPSADRVAPPCSLARAGGCGGCDFQHASLAAQRRYKAAVLAEQMARLAGLDVNVAVEGLPGADGLGWRTRMRLAVTADGEPGLHRHRSDEIVATPECLLAHPLVHESGALTRKWPGAHTVEVAASVASGEVAVVVDGVGQSGPTRLQEAVGERTFRVHGLGFWQVHPAAAEVFAAAVSAAAEIVPGERVADLYAGVGLFAAFLSDATGPTGRVDVVEADDRAVRDAKRNLHDLPQARLHRARVADWLRDGDEIFDVCVLDPPRSGAGTKTISRIADRTRRRLVYVACDPAALARDTAALLAHGWALAGLRAFDAFTMTHHVEAIAWFDRAA